MLLQLICRSAACLDDNDTEANEHWIVYIEFFSAIGSECLSFSEDFSDGSAQTNGM